MNESPIFIVGCPRSGTGLLRDLLRSHPRLSFPRESQFIPAFARGYGDPRDEREALRLAARILRLPAVQSWELSVAPQAFAGDRTFAAVLHRLYGEFARSEGKVRWGDKTPQYVTEIPTLLQIFPEAKIIHIYRDGRDVAASWLRAQFGPRNVYTAARAWKRMVACGQRSGTLFPAKTYLEIRYETLVVDPEATMRQVCGFLDEPFDPAILTPSRLPRSGRRAIVGTGERSWVAEMEVTPAHVDRWKLDLSVADRMLFESIAGDLLASLGYQVDGKVRPVPAWEEWAWTMHHRVHWLFYRLDFRRMEPAAFLQLQWAALRFRMRSRHATPRAAATPSRGRQGGSRECP